MIKRAAAVIIAACLSISVLSGCGHQIQDRGIKFIKQEKMENKENNTSSADSSFAADYPSPQTDLDDISADNMDFYKERLVVAGDSIAVGWNMFGVLPKSQVIAQGGISTAGYSRWEYDTTGKTMSMLDTMKAVKPSLLYICLGMNDVGNIDADTYVSEYKSLISSILKVVPDCYIVAASITPLAKVYDYPQVSRSEIKVFNEKLREMISQYGRENVIFFDAHSTLLDADDNLDEKYNSGDGLHVNTEAYNRLLLMLTKRLNQQVAQPRIEAVEKARKKSS